jgi:hypothetical protein
VFSRFRNNYKNSTFVTMLRKLLIHFTVLSLLLSIVPTSWLHWDEALHVVSEEVSCSSNCLHSEGHIQGSPHKCLLLQLFVDFTDLFGYYRMALFMPTGDYFLNAIYQMGYALILLFDLSRGPPPPIGYLYCTVKGF